MTRAIDYTCHFPTANEWSYQKGPNTLSNGSKTGDFVCKTPHGPLPFVCQDINHISIDAKWQGLSKFHKREIILFDVDLLIHRKTT
jgi:hypothetical protein